ncbi:PilW family protein [Luteimonas changyuni]
MTSCRQQAGVTLIELMIALGIGALLLLGLVEVFSASRTAYQLSSGLARSQENGRFAIDFLQRDMRMAGHAGCVNDQARFLPENVTPSRPALVSTFLSPTDQSAGNYAPAGLSHALRFDKPIEAYEANGTNTGGTLVLPAVLEEAENSSEWSPVLPATLFSSLIKPVPGSDILVLRTFTASGAQITSFTPGDPATVRFTASHSGRLTEGVPDPRLFAIADCMGAAVFKGDYTSLAAGEIQVAGGNGNLSSLATLPVATGQAMLYRADSLVYYVGLNPQDVPSLYRLRYSVNATGGLTSINEELVEGIESMQLRFGQDSFTGSQRPSGNIGTATTADALVGATPEEAWRRVGMAQIGLLARSTEPAAAGQRQASDVTPPLSMLGLTITPPDDTFYRSVYEDSIALRNRLFGN